MTAARAALALAALALLGCPGASQPVVVQQTLSAPAGTMKRVGVVPFYPRPALARDAEAQDLSSEEIAELVTSFFAEALASQGVDTVPPSDVEFVFEREGRPLLRLDPRAVAELATPEFGLSSLLVGQVYRWRERTGEALGSDTPASVGFEASLFDSVAGRRLWTSRFDHTQRTITGDPLTARKYPGSGTRWLTAAELARWGVRNAVEALVAGPWRASR